MKTTSFRYVIPHAILILLTLAAIVRFAAGKYGMALVYSSVILFWLFYNLMALVYAVLFMLGRDSRRKYERIRAEERLRMNYQGKWYLGETIDVSEEGVAFWFAHPVPVKEGERCRLFVDTAHYHARLKAVTVHVKEEEERQFLAAVVEPEEEESRRHWMQIIHDREHSLPKEIDPWMTVYDDISRNIRLRFFAQKRNG